jgi:hypothetical protein
MSGYLSIDGNEYQVPVLTVKRSVEFLDRFAMRTQDGVLHRELIGTFINYQITFAKPTSIAEASTYGDLWSILAEATEWHDFITPDGYEFTGYVGTGVTDSIHKIWSAENFWKDLSVSLVAQSPEATP